MNFKERGITVGDLLIILIVIVTTSILMKTFKNDKKTTINHINQENISYNKTLSSRIYLTDISV